MVNLCGAPGCTKHRGQGKGREFYRIPKDPALREKWISAIKRARSVLKKITSLCRDHFIFLYASFLTETITNSL
uniref:THAP domain-containing protein 1 n=1 Tax=Gouania willdenowi TaxID=441366 RepID=A0A8C5H345_GOUWI